MDNTPALQDPAKRKAFIEMVENQENYWNLPNYTEELGELIAAAPANKYELNLSKDLLKNIKSYDVKNWTPDYNILNDFTGTYGFGKRQALLRSQKVFDYLSKSSKLNKIYKAEKAGYNFMSTPEGATINIPKTTTNPEDKETESKYKL
jgi:hypothetical protein